MTTPKFVPEHLRKPDLSVAALAAEFGPLVFIAAHRILGDHSQAEDVQQEVYLRLLQRPPTAVVSWPAYLTATATRLAIDVLRRQQRWWKLLPLWQTAQPTAVEDISDTGPDANRAAVLRRALATLSPREAQCFSLRYLQEMEIASVAQALGISVNSVSVSLHRAKQRLETHIERSRQEQP